MLEYYTDKVTKKKVGTTNCMPLKTGRSKGTVNDSKNKKFQYIVLNIENYDT